uniref:Uncharacterized protein n=1 Tax=Chenopodium quinoa TaxID=63459 RepID=A0A803MS25_CHEQI
MAVGTRAQSSLKIEKKQKATQKSKKSKKSKEIMRNLGEEMEDPDVQSFLEEQILSPKASLKDLQQQYEVRRNFSD